VQQFVSGTVILYMKPILLFVLLIAGCISTAQQPPSIPVENMQADFDLLRKSMEEAHGGLYRFASKQVTDARFDSYRKKIPAMKSSREFMSLMMQVLADTRDGHMRFALDENTQAAFARAKSFPFSVNIEDNRTMVLYNETAADTTIKPGTEILTINGQKTGELLRLIYAKLPADGYIETGKQKRLEQAFGAFYWLLIDSTDQFTLSARDRNGKTINTTFPGVSNSERNKNRNDNKVNAQVIANVAQLEGSRENISLQFLRGNDIAYLRIRGFQGNDFYQQIDSVFKTVHNKKAKAFILDLRGNGGGTDQYGAWLVSKFVTKPFRYFDRIHLATLQPSFTSFTESTLQDLRNGTVTDPKGGYLVTPKLHPGVGEQQPGEFPFTGKTYVLMDGNTFSTAADVTALMRHLTKAVFIGEESGGGFEGNTSGLNAQLVLPHSKLRLRIQMYEYWNAVTVTERGRGTKPDHFIPKRITDLMNAVDAPLEQAIKLVK
jgi:hypothetical protein